MNLNKIKELIVGESVLGRTLRITIIFLFFIGVSSPFLKSEGPTHMQFIEIMLLSATLVMAIEIRKQVLEEKKYLENFEPQIEIYGENNPIRLKSSQHTLTGSFMALNTSQTSALITNAEVKELDSKVPLRGYKSIHSSQRHSWKKYDYAGKIQVVPDNPVYVTFKVDSIKEELEDKDLDIFTLVVEGNFEKEEIQVTFQ